MPSVRKNVNHNTRFESLFHGRVVQDPTLKPPHHKVQIIVGFAPIAPEIRRLNTSFRKTAYSMLLAAFILKEKWFSILNQKA